MNERIRSRICSNLYPVTFKFLDKLFPVILRDILLQALPRGDGISKESLVRSCGWSDVGP